MSISDLPEECMECEYLAEQVKKLQRERDDAHSSMIQMESERDHALIDLKAWQKTGEQAYRAICKVRDQYHDRAEAAEGALIECQKQLDAATALALRLMEKPIWVIPEMEK